MELTNIEKKEYFQFCLDVYTLEYDEFLNKYSFKFFNRIDFFCFLELKENGFCLLFKIYYDSFYAVLPIELLNYKPKKHFYDCYNTLTNDNTQFWFPLGDNKKRIKILKKELKKLNKIL